MRGKLLFAAGIATGYVVGARAGRSAYDSVVERVKGVAGNPKVKQVGEKAKTTLEEKAPKLADVAEKAASTAAGAAAAASEAGADSSDASSSEPASAAPKPVPTPKPSTSPTTPIPPLGDGSVV
jgi:hypothetical protein